MGPMFGWPVPAILADHHHAILFAMVQFLLLLPIVVLNGVYFTRGFLALMHRAPNMDSLIAVGAGAAMLHGIVVLLRMAYLSGVADITRYGHFGHDLYFESAGTILTLITLGKLLEARAKGKTTEALDKLMALAPKTATVLKNGREIKRPLEEVLVGDILVIRAGEALPLDGRVTQGHGAVDEAALTGESLPVEKKEGDRVIGGTLLKSGYLNMRVEQIGEDTVLAGIIRLVDEATGSKAPIAKLADRVAGVFVPVVMTIALGATLIWLWRGATVSFALSIGISVLVVSCPCALGLATPTAIMVGTGLAARHGILFKSAESLEITGTVRHILLDKTGTVTEGRPRVTDILSENGQEKKLLSYAFSLEEKSDHPLARAVVAYARQENIPSVSVQDFENIPGGGVRGKIEGRMILGGNRRLLEEQVGLALTEGQQRDFEKKWAEEGKTPLYFAYDHRFLGIISVSDTVKSDSTAAIGQLKKDGLTVTLLTGDHQKTAQHIAQEIGVDEVVAEVFPDQKEHIVRAQQKKNGRVAMVGDGINDAPALVAADVGIAIGAGTDIALEAADVVLMKSRLTDVVSAISLSRATMRNIKQNLFWAFFYNVLGIPVAAGVFYHAFGWTLNPMLAAMAMSLSSVFVVTNALRLRFFKPPVFSEESRGTRTERAISPKKIELSRHKYPYATSRQKGDEEVKMEKTLKIEGMSCPHCVRHVTDALNAIKGVTVQKVSLEEKTALIKLSQDIDDDVLKEAVEKAGYTFIGV